MTGPRSNVRRPREITPGEHASYLKTLDAVAKVHDRRQAQSPIPKAKS